MQVTSTNPFTGKPSTKDLFTGQAPHRRVLQLQQQQQNHFINIVWPILNAQLPNLSKRKLKNSEENTPPNKK
jgi:hypothetical protein